MADQNVTTMDAHKSVWKLVWDMGVMSKIKVFIWRLIHNILPYVSNLRRRGIPMDSTCAVCGGVEDCWQHIFFTCYYSHAIWSGIGFWNKIHSFLSIAEDNFWFDLLLRAKEKDLFNLVCCTLWLLWNNRNTCFHSHKCVNLEVLISCASRIASESTNQHETSAGPTDVASWRPPPFGKTKINVDASLIPGLQGASLGIVTRSDDGLVLFSAKVMKLYTTSHLTAEIEAILQGLLLAYEWGLRDVILETDCLQALTEIRREGHSLIQDGFLVADIRKLSSLFNTCNIVFVRRSANILAHDLAKSSTDAQTKIICPGGLPPNVCNMDSVE
ncbi:hypothetical protein REPUB_Repub12eG0059700 [Reevesia pubescens]